jgi:ribosome-binding protein aMBF1 (putative translation factor)
LAAARARTATTVMNKPAWKIEKALEEGERLPRVRPEDAKRVVAGRVRAKLTRAQLAQRLNLREKDIADIENGTALENKALLARIRRLLDQIGDSMPTT